MGQAAVVSGAASEIDTLAVALAAAVPSHWTGRAAESYRRSATNLGTGLTRHGERLHALAARVHAHEIEAAAIRTAMSATSVVAV